MNQWLRIAVSIGVLTLLFLVLPWTDVRAAVGAMPPTVWLAVLAGFVAGHGAGALKWRLMVNAGHCKLGSVPAIRCYAAGLFANLCLPTIVGGDILRAALASGVTGRPQAAVWGGIADRVIDVAALSMLIFAGAVLAGNAVPGWDGQVFLLLPLAGAAVSMAGLVLAMRRPLARWPRKFRRPIGRNLAAVRRIARSPRRAGTAFLIAVGLQGCFVLLNAWIGRSIGIDVPLAVWFLVWPLAKVAGLLPISIGGLGVRDATQGALLLALGVPAALGVVASLVWQSVLIVGGLLAGILWKVLDHTPGQAPSPSALQAPAP